MDDDALTGLLQPPRKRSDGAAALWDRQRRWQTAGVDVEDASAFEPRIGFGKTADEVKARGYNLDIKNPYMVADDHGDPEELLASLTTAEAETAKLRDQLKAILAEALAR